MCFSVESCPGSWFEKDTEEGTVRQDYDKLIACSNDPDSDDYLTVAKEIGAGLRRLNY